MKADAANIVTLTSVANDLEAATILSVLEEHGIAARAVGGFTARFRAEAPGDVQILVKQHELAQAQDLLSELEREQGQVDWSAVDVGDDLPPEESTTKDERRLANSSLPQQAGQQDSRRIHFRLCTLLVIQTVVCIMFTLLRDARAAAICAALLIAVMGLSIVAGTVLVTTSLELVKKWLRYVLLVGILVEIVPLIRSLLRFLF